MLRIEGPYSGALHHVQVGIQIIYRRAILDENLLVRRRSRFSQDIMSGQALKAMLAILADEAGTKLGGRDIILLQRSSSFTDTRVSESLS